jgi:hypothetical protein
MIHCAALATYRVWSFTDKQGAIRESGFAKRSVLLSARQGIAIHLVILTLCPLAQLPTERMRSVSLLFERHA